MLIELRQAGRAFQGTWALHALTEKLHSGTIYALLGANGAGKSTLLRLLAGWLPLSAGRILMDDSPIRPTATHVRRRVILLEEISTGSSQRPVVPLHQLCRMIDDYRADRPGIQDEVASWFERLGVISVYQSDARQMSKGQAYKIAMIGLFVIRPTVWLLDESILVPLLTTAFSVATLFALRTLLVASVVSATSGTFVALWIRVIGAWAQVLLAIPLFFLAVIASLPFEQRVLPVLVSQGVLQVLSMSLFGIAIGCWYYASRLPDSAGSRSVRISQHESASHRVE